MRRELSTISCHSGAGSMNETSYRQAEASLPKSSDVNKNVWLGGEPIELIKKGYAEAIDISPCQSQRSAEFDTRGESSNDATSIAPTAIKADDGKTRILHIPEPLPETRHWVTMHPLQEWEGYIIGMRESQFVARLRDLTAESSASDRERVPEEEATVSSSEVSDEDLGRMQVGSVFRWVIGYERAATGTKRRISQIVFRDLPSLTQEDKIEGLSWAREIMASLKE